VKHLTSLIVALLLVGASTAHAVELFPDESAPPPLVVFAPAYVPPLHPVRRVIVRDDGARERVVIVDRSAPRLVLGAGGGAWFSIGEQTSVAPFGHARLGFELESAELAVRTMFAPSIAQYGVEAAFVYRFFPDEIVHPYLGAGLGAVIDASAGASVGFGVSVRAGVEIAADLGDAGTVAVGVDAIGTQVAFADDRFLWERGTSVATSLHLDYRL
jgi:hypothetical protein